VLNQCGYQAATHPETIEGVYRPKSLTVIQQLSSRVGAQQQPDSRGAAQPQQQQLDSEGA